MTTRDDWFDEAQRKRRAAERKRRRLDRIILGTLAAVLVAAGVFLYVVGGENEAPSPTGGAPVASSTAPPTAQPTKAEAQAFITAVAEARAGLAAPPDVAGFAARVDSAGCLMSFVGPEEVTEFTAKAEDDLARPMDSITRALVKSAPLPRVILVDEIVRRGEVVEGFVLGIACP